MFNYYDACENGLARASASLGRPTSSEPPLLRIGGPLLRIGGPTTHSGDSAGEKDDPVGPFLAHCDTGTNYFSNQSGTRLDFISIHRKGSSRSVPGGGNSSRILANERPFLQLIRDEHPKFRDIPFWNDEADPLSGWSKELAWRPGPIYPAFMVATIAEHLLAMDGASPKPRIDGVVYDVLSNDNAFSGGWEERTLLTTFAPVGNISIDATLYAVIKKPDLTVMSLLDRLGPSRSLLGIAGADRNTALGGVASASKACTSVLLFRSNNTAPHNRTAVNISVVFASGTRQAADGAMLAEWRLDNDHGNPYAAWVAAGSPNWPIGRQLAAMEATQDPVLLHLALAARTPPQRGDAPAGPRATGCTVSLPLPGVSLVQLCERPGAGPRAPSTPSVVMIQQGRATAAFWAAAALDTLRTYVVESSVDGGHTFFRANAQDLIGTAFIHSHSAGGTMLGAATPSKRCYRVSVVDFWGRTSPPSATACLACEPSPVVEVAAAAVVVEVGLDERAGRTAASYLSVAIDAGAMVYPDKWPLWEQHMDSANFTKLCRALATTGAGATLLRLGGTPADGIRYAMTPGAAPKGCTVPISTVKTPTPQQPYMLGACQFSAIARWAEGTGIPMVFDLNVLSDRTPGPDGGRWDPTNALALIAYANKYHPNVVGWELGNEPEGWLRNFGINVSGRALAADYHRLRTELDEIRAGGGPDQLLIGPEYGIVGCYRSRDGCAGYAATLAAIGLGVVNMSTVHFYNLGKGDTIAEFELPQVLDETRRATETAVNATRAAGITAPVWIGETATASGGGIAGASGTFTAVAMWLDRLGSVGRWGGAGVMRQSLFGGRYALLDPDTFVPRPTYWVALLFKRLVGGSTAVLSVGGDDSANRTLRIYARCGVGIGGGSNSSVVLFGSNVGGAAETLHFGSGLGSEDRKDFVLTGESYTLRLNGEVVVQGTAGEVPATDGADATAGTPLVLEPGASFFSVFSVFRRAAGRGPVPPVCMRTRQ